MNWSGMEIGKAQNHYRAARAAAPREISITDIEGVCACGYVQLRPANDFERHNGGLMVKRSAVTVMREDGRVLKRIRGRKINRYHNCNHCVNKW